MWIAGLRGAMAYALALDASKGKDNQAGKVMLIVTLLYSLFTILGISSILYPVMQKCEVTKSSEPEQREDETEQELLEKVNQRRTPCARLKNSISEFDRYYFSPLFIKETGDIRVGVDQN